MTANDRILELLRELPDDGDDWSERKAATFDAIATEAERRGDHQLARAARTAAKRARAQLDSRRSAE